MFQGGDGQQCRMIQERLDERSTELAILSHEGWRDTCFDKISGGGRRPIGKGRGIVGGKEMEVMKSIPFKTLSVKGRSKDSS